ncbi:MAG TPA: hypothetical protein DCZ05_09005 [Deltaproteobacteria bacterium]|nr:hypothetical protein [Deltaproteobacteria bacterium]
MAQDIPKRLIIATLWTVLTLAASMIYAGQFGPPEPITNEGKVSIGVGYFHSSGKLNAENSSDLFIAQHKIQQNQPYLQAGYGFIKNWEAYLRVGGADLEVENAFSFDSSLSRSNTSRKGLRPFGTLGVKGLLYDGFYFGLGPFFQGSIFSSYEDKKTRVRPSGLCCNSDEVKIKNPWDVNFGIGVQTKLYGVTLYGGPFAYWTGYKADKLFLSPILNLRVVWAVRSVVRLELWWIKPTTGRKTILADLLD